MWFPFNLVLLLGLVSLVGCTPLPMPSEGIVQASTLPDLSGLAWVEGDTFLGVHDAKRNTEKIDWPRLSLIHLPESELEGVTWEEQNVVFPGPEGRSSDLESASPIPGNRGYLFAESGQEGEEDRRIFHAVYEDGIISIVAHTAWPVPITNVEAIEVASVGDQLVFIYAERAEGEPETRVRWTNFSLDPMAFGEFQEVTYRGVDPVGPGARPIVALSVDSKGHIYSVSAFDTGDDNGPFRSVVWHIGQILSDSNGQPVIELGEGQRLATLDGLKVESIAVREMETGEQQIYIGTDDEHFGGIIRLLPPTP